MAKSGAQKGNVNAKRHGLIAVKDAVARRVRRGRDRVDKRTLEGREALDLRGRYIEDKGGMDNLSTGEFMGIIGLSEAWWLRAMQYGAVAKYLRKNPHLTSNPKAIAQMFQYISPIEEKIIRYLQLLGLDKKPPPQKTLEQYLEEQCGTDPDEGKP
jgi:hypothetical protein